MHMLEWVSGVSVVNEQCWIILEHHLHSEAWLACPHVLILIALKLRTLHPNQGVHQSQYVMPTLCFDSIFCSLPFGDFLGTLKVLNGKLSGTFHLPQIYHSPLIYHQLAGSFPTNHVECTKTWMWELSSVCGSVLKSAKPYSSWREDPKRVQSSGSRWLSNMWHKQNQDL